MNGTQSGMGLPLSSLPSARAAPFIGLMPLIFGVWFSSRRRLRSKLNLETTSNRFHVVSVLKKPPRKAV
jgi:hypothetical protein